MPLNNPPQQRKYPGEGPQKCNPEQDARAPLFSNAVDPPPQRPWPTTSDEGKSAPHPASPVDRKLHTSWMVVVEQNKVVGCFSAHDYRERNELMRLTVANSQARIYEAVTTTAHAPAIGASVDPAALGWKQIG